MTADCAPCGGVKTTDRYPSILRRSTAFSASAFGYGVFDNRVLVGLCPDGRQFAVSKLGGQAQGPVR